VVAVVLEASFPLVSLFLSDLCFCFPRDFFISRLDLDRSLSYIPCVVWSAVGDIVECGERVCSESSGQVLSVGACVLGCGLHKCFSVLGVLEDVWSRYFPFQFR
jgi:hypothetical protein